MQKRLYLLFVFKVVITIQNEQNLVASWGQIRVHQSEGTENGLNKYCSLKQYDVIDINLLYNIDDQLRMDLSKHCSWIPDKRNILNCHALEKTISACQQNKKKLFITLGGVEGKDMTISSKVKAEKLATDIWNMFFGGSSSTRPFNRAILDGLTIHLSSATKNANHWIDFVVKLRQLMKTDHQKSYFISIMTGCEYPDKNFQDFYSKVIEYINNIFVVLDGMPCDVTGSGLVKTVNHWGRLKTSGARLMVYLRLPVSSKISPTLYMTPTSLSKVYDKHLRTARYFGGFYLWDAAYDDQTSINGKTYSQHLGKMIAWSKVSGQATTTSTSIPATTESTTTTKKTMTAPTKTTTTIRNYIKYFQLVGQWGQNKVYNYKKKSELELGYYCLRASYDVIIIKAVHIFSDVGNNKDGLPGMTFAKHCPFSFGKNYPTYLRCDKIARQIKFCQHKGKKILLSIGGEGARFNGFVSVEESKLFAKRLWDLFLGGTHNLRTFNSAIPDGINLEIVQGGQRDYFNEFLQELRKYMDSDPNRNYLITTTATCTFPHFQLGKTYKQSSHLFDAFYISFVDDCNTTSIQSFETSLKKWISLPGPKIYLGLQSSSHILRTGIYYINRMKTIQLYKKYASKYSRIGGIMLSDVGYDDINVVGGLQYSDYIKRTFKPESYTTTVKPSSRKPCSICSAGSKTEIFILLIVFSIFYQIL